MGCAALLAAPACLGVPESHVTPTPGLYRVDVDARFGQANGNSQTRMRTDGATGDVRGEMHERGAPGYKHAVKGAAPVTQCIKPYKGTDVVRMLPLLPGACKNQRIKETSDGAIVTAECSAGLITTTIRKLSADEWEYIIDTPYNTHTPVASDLSFLIPVLQAQIKNAPSAEARAKVEKQLADILLVQKQMAEMSAAKASQPQAQAGKLPASAPSALMHGRSRAVLTKISNTCN